MMEQMWTGTGIGGCREVLANVGSFLFRPGQVESLKGYCGYCKCVVDADGHGEVCGTLKNVMELLGKLEENEPVRQRYEFIRQRLGGSGEEEGAVVRRLLRVSIGVTALMREVAELESEENEEGVMEVEQVSKESMISNRYRVLRDECAQISRTDGTKAERESVWRQIQEIGVEWKRYYGEMSSLTAEEVGGDRESNECVDWLLLERSD